MADKNVRDQIEEIATEICEHYCKYPDEWDVDKEGIELFESDICKNCPLRRL